MKYQIRREIQKVSVVVVNQVDHGAFECPEVRFEVVSETLGGHTLPAVCHELIYVEVRFQKIVG